MSVERDRCAVEALRIALKYLRGPNSVAEGGNLVLTERGKDEHYVRMTLNLYQDVLDERGAKMVAAPFPE
jgi:hypothetical protein